MKDNTIHPTHVTHSNTLDALDCNSRQSAIDALNNLIDRFERILSDIRESKGDDTVCGLCEYDGAYIGVSGDWCNECPGFDREDCFKLSEERRKKWIGATELPSVQPDVHDTNVGDMISRQAAIDEINKYILSFDAIDANFLDGLKTAIKIIKENFPSAQPDLSDYSDKLWKAAYERGKAETEQRWIPVSERLPDSMGWDQQYLVSLVWGGVGTMEYKSTGFHNYGSFQPVPIEIVTAWMPLPEPYKAERREDG